MFNLFTQSLLRVMACLGFIFIYRHSPLRLGLLVVLESFLVSLTIFLTSSTSWFSYLLFIIFLRGIIIIFIYVSSLAANEFFFTNFFLFSFLFITLVGLVRFLKMNFLVIRGLVDYSLNSSASLCFKVYAPFIYALTVVIIVYLLVALLVVVKNSLFSEGPLRSKKG